VGPSIPALRQLTFQVKFASLSAIAAVGAAARPGPWPDHYLDTHVDIPRTYMREARFDPHGHRTSGRPRKMKRGASMPRSS
jgi:hypothetical protein